MRNVCVTSASVIKRIQGNHTPHIIYVNSINGYIVIVPVVKNIVKIKKSSILFIEYICFKHIYSRARRHARAHARTHARTHARARARTHVRTRAYARPHGSKVNVSDQSAEIISIIVP